MEHEEVLALYTYHKDEDYFTEHKIAPGRILYEAADGHLRLSVMNGF